MMSETGEALLSAGDPPAVRVINPGGRSSFLLLGDHAGNAVPSRLRSLGLAEADLRKHIAWDIGVGALGATLAVALDAPFIRQTYSRLVIDCNRDPARPDAIIETSDAIAIPGNANCDETERTARYTEIHRPYHDTIATELAGRDKDGRTTILIALHSFTPVMDKRRRPWQIGILHADGDARFAQELLRLLGMQDALVVGDNQPYRMDSTDYTIPRHAFGAYRRYAEIEIRQDLLATHKQQTDWCTLLADIFEAAI